MSKIPPARLLGKKMLYSKPPTSFSKSSLAKGDRTADSVANDHIAKEYTNTHIWRSPEGSYKAHCIADGKELYEYMHASSTGYKILPDGSYDKTVTGNHRYNVKGGTTESIMETRDKKVGGHDRDIVGTQQSAAVPAGRHTEVGGNRTTFIAGMDTQAQAMASGRGHYGLGKHTMNYEKGIGFGVNKGSTPHVWQRMYEDGSYLLQVQPKGETGGVAVVHIDKDGEITITTDKSITIEAKDKITLNGRTGVDIKSGKNISLKAGGDVITKGRTTKIQGGGPRVTRKTFT